MTVGEGVLHGRLCVLLLGHERHVEAEEAAAQHNRKTVSQVSSETNSNQYKPAATVWSGYRVVSWVDRFAIKLVNEPSSEMCTLDLHSAMHH